MQYYLSKLSTYQWIKILYNAIKNKYIKIIIDDKCSAYVAEEGIRV